MYRGEEVFDVFGDDGFFVKVGSCVGCLASSVCGVSDATVQVGRKLYGVEDHALDACLDAFERSARVIKCSLHLTTSTNTCGRILEESSTKVAYGFEH